MSDQNNLLITSWEEFKVLVESIDQDFYKNVEKGNKSAGVRVRKSLRMIKKEAGNLVKATLENDK
jgi:hypothetical protein